MKLKSLILGETDINTGGTAPALYQNNPNPFSAQTEIRFFLPEQVKSATLYYMICKAHNYKAYMCNNVVMPV